MNSTEQKGLETLKLLASDVEKESQEAGEALVEFIDNPAKTYGFSYIESYNDPSLLCLYHNEECVTITRNREAKDAIRAFFPVMQVHIEHLANSST